MRAKRDTDPHLESAQKGKGQKRRIGSTDGTGVWVAGKLHATVWCGVYNDPCAGPVDWISLRLGNTSKDLEVTCKAISHLHSRGSQKIHIVCEPCAENGARVQAEQGETVTVGEQGRDSTGPFLKFSSV